MIEDSICYHGKREIICAITTRRQIKFTIKERRQVACAITAKRQITCVIMEKMTDNAGYAITEKNPDKIRRKDR